MAMLIASTDGLGLLPATPEVVWGATPVLILVVPILVVAGLFVGVKRAAEHREGLEAPVQRLEEAILDDPSPRR